MWSYVTYLMQIDLLTKNTARDKSKSKGLQSKMLGGDPGSYEKAAGEGRAGGANFSQDENWFPSPFACLWRVFLKKQHQKHIWKSPWYVNIIRQSVAQSKFPIDTRWMLYSILSAISACQVRKICCGGKGVGVDPLNEILVLYNFFFKKFSAEHTSHFHNGVPPPPNLT